MNHNKVSLYGQVLSQRLLLQKKMLDSLSIQDDNQKLFNDITLQSGHHGEHREEQALNLVFPLSLHIF